MTQDEALKLALETLENSRVFVMSREMIKQPEGADWYDNRITAIKEALTIDVAAGSQAFYGFPHGPVSTPNAGGKCVTAGETAPPKEIDPNQWAFDNGLEST